MKTSANIITRRVDNISSLQMAMKIYFGHQFTAWASFLIFIFLPLDLLFRIDSFLISMSILDVVVGGAALSLFSAFAALLLSVLIVSITSAFRFFFGGTVPARFYQATCVTVLFLTVYTFSKSLKIWANSLNVPLPGKVIYSAILFFIIIACIWRSSMYSHVNNALRSVSKLLYMTILAAVVVTAARVIIVELKDTSRNAASLTADTKNKPNIILITFDALAADDMSLYGYALPTTPKINEFARKSIVYNNAYSSSNTTLFAVSSMMSGMYPNKNGIKGFNTYSRLPASIAENSMPALLQQAGYRTYASVAVTDFAHPAALGLSRFFDKAPLDYVDWKNVPVFYWPGQLSLALRHFGGLALADRYGINSALWLSEYLRENLHSFGKILGRTYSEPLFPPAKVVTGAAEIIKSHQLNHGTAPFFIWVHFFTPHSPYLPGAGYKFKFMNDSKVFADFKSMIPFTDTQYEIDQQSSIDKLRLRYDENIAYADAGFGQLLQALNQLGVVDNSLMIVAADHGESFSHGYVGHGGSMLTRSLIHIPMLMKLPGNAGSARSDKTVSLVDIPPTILKYAGKQQPPQMRGESLLDPDVSGRAIISMVPGNGRGSAIPVKSAAIIRSPYKLFYDDKTERHNLYNIESDPDENNDLAQTEKTVAAALLKELASCVLIRSK